MIGGKDPWKDLYSRRFCYLTCGVVGFPGGSVVKIPPAYAGNAEDVGLIPGLERSPKGGHGTQSSIFAWRIPWTEEPGRL